MDPEGLQRRRGHDRALIDHHQNHRSSTFLNAGNLEETLSRQLEDILEAPGFKHFLFLGFRVLLVEESLAGDLYMYRTSSQG